MTETPISVIDTSTQTLEHGSWDSHESTFTTFMAGYNDCFEETVQFIVEAGDGSTGRGDQLSGRLFSHLRQHLEDVASKNGEQCWCNPEK